MIDTKPLEEIRQRLERTEEHLEELVKDLQERKKELEEASTLPGLGPIPPDCITEPQE